MLSTIGGDNGSMDNNDDADAEIDIDWTQSQHRQLYTLSEGVPPSVSMLRDEIQAWYASGVFRA